MVFALPIVRFHAWDGSFVPYVEAALAFPDLQSCNQLQLVVSTLGLYGIMEKGMETTRYFEG